MMSPPHRPPITRAQVIELCRSLGLDERTTEWIRIEPQRITAGGHTDIDHPWLIDLPVTEGDQPR